MDQVADHCTRFEEMVLSKKYKQAFLEKIFGKRALKNLLKNENR